MLTLYQQSQVRNSGFSRVAKLTFLLLHEIIQCNFLQYVVTGDWMSDLFTLLIGRLSVQTSQVAHQAGVYPSFCCMK